MQSKRAETAAHDSMITGRLRPREWIALLLCGLLGIVLRLDQISGQVIADDEWHSLHAIRDRDLGWILTHFGAADHCIPLTAFEWMLAHTVGLSELGMRALSLVCGIAALFVLPLMLRRHLGGRAACVSALLLAIAPLEVFYSRCARPYEVVFLLPLVAVLALERWWSGGSRIWSVVYVASAVLAVWFHLVVAPFVLAPLVWCFVFGRRVPRIPDSAGRSRIDVALLGGVTLSLIASIIGPPLIADLNVLRDRSFERAESIPDLQQSLQLFGGTASPWLSFLFGLLLVFGFFRFRRTQRALVPWLVVPVIAQLAALAVARPAEIHEAPVFVRYQMPSHLLVLVVAALGLIELEDLLRKEWPRLPQHVFTSLAALAFLAFGPLPSIDQHPCNWTNHAMFQSNYAPSFLTSFARSVFNLREIPPVYESLAAQMHPGEILLEAPWFYVSKLVPFPIYQRFHRQSFMIGFVTNPTAPLPLGELRPDDERFHMRNFAHVTDIARLRERNVRFVIFHRDLPVAIDEQNYVDLAQLEACIARYRERFGPPCFEDERMCVFDLRPN